MKQDINRIKELVNITFGERNIIDCVRMGGLTNRSYHVVCKDEQTGKTQELAVRLPGIGTENMIIRSDEQKSLELACKLGIDAQLYFFDSMTGEKVTEYIDNSKTMHVEDLRKNVNIVRMAQIFSKLHSCGEDTGVSFDVIDMAGTYEHIIRSEGGSFYDDYTEIKRYVDNLKKGYMLNVTKVPCHNDPLCENWMLQNNEKMYLIDWEYSGMNDPMWDLADVSIECDMNPEKDDLFLYTYFGRRATSKDWHAFRVNKVLIDYLWSLWGKTRAIYDGEKMEVYAYERWQRMKRNMEVLKGTG